MRSNSILLTTCLLCGLAATAAGQDDPQPPLPAPATPVFDPVKVMVERLDLEKYKATIKGLTAFGDRRQGTERNRKAVDWIEAQLKSYGCTNTERIVYTYPSPEASDPASAGRGRGAGQRPAAGAVAAPTRRTLDRGAAVRAAAPSSARAPAPGSTTRMPRGRRLSIPACARSMRSRRRRASGRKSTARRSAPRGPTRCTSSAPTWTASAGARRPTTTDSGTAIVMELARIFSAPDVETERSIRFVLWNNEESGLNGAWAYVNQRKDRQGKEDPPGSGRYPEPKWLGMIQHDMMMWDHGMPGPDGKVSPEQRREADVNIEFQSTAKMAEGAQALAWVFKTANNRYATDYPATVGPHMSNTDSGPFMNLVPAISLRENERGPQIGAGWDPELAPAERRVHDLLRQGLPVGVERRPDDAWGRWDSSQARRSRNRLSSRTAVDQRVRQDVYKYSCVRWDSIKLNRWERMHYPR